MIADGGIEEVEELAKNNKKTGAYHKRPLL
jgi:hypothetical protein